MKIFDPIILKTQELLSSLPYSSFEYAPGKAAPEGNVNDLVLGKEAAFELGAADYSAVHYTAVTREEAIVPRDEILVYGRDLSEIKADCSFARITLLRTDDIEEEGEQGAYAIIEKIEQKKFDVAPKGYMMRASALSTREQVRVAKTAVKHGISFEAVGNLIISKYKENEHVLAVKIIFVTLPDGPYIELDKLANTSYQMIKALNHIIADLKMDCHTCNFKPICDEVEGMKELHLKKAKKNK
ncbi:MAG: carbon monoxide dehydrogenase [Oscillospiraceae bacterium]